jgi:DNA-binding response OmpR family regulator
MGRRILVVDDERDILNSVKEGLRHRGYDVDGYTDPLEALKDFKAHVYDLLLLDVKMPKVNGFELYKMMMKLDGDVKVCFMTAYESYRDDFRQAFPELDERRFISKPATLSKLIERLSEELSRPVKNIEITKANF